MEIPQSVVLGAGVGALRSIEAWLTKDQSFDPKKFLKTIGNGIWQGAATGLIVQDPLTLFGLVYVENVSVHDVWKRLFAVAKKKK